MSLLEQTARWTDVRGSRLPALERNLVRYRSLQIVAYLREAEAFKVFLEGLSTSTDANDNLASKTSDPPLNYKRKQWKSVAPWKRATEELHRLGHMTCTERDQLIDLIDYRNSIAHDVEYLFADMGTNRTNREFLAEPELYPAKFEYGNLTLLRNLKLKLYDRIGGKFLMTIDMSGALFESTERFINSELATLQAKIGKLMDRRRAEMSSVAAELKRHSKSWDWRAGIYPLHPDYLRTNGTLTKKGVEALENLFADGLTDLACALFMNLSVKSVRLRRSNFEMAGRSLIPCLPS